MNPSYPAPANAAAEWISAFSSALGEHDVDAIVDLFHADGWYRDVLALTWSLQTYHGHDEIRAVFEERLAGSGLRSITTSDAFPPMTVPDALGGEAFVQAAVSFETETVRGRGLVAIRPDAEGSWRAQTFMLQIVEIIGHEERSTSFDNAQDPEYTRAQTGRLRPREAREARLRYEQGDPDVVVIGAGHAGLSVAAHLSHLGIDTLVVDKHTRIGDNWRKRYANLILHDPSWLQHFPYISYPKSWPFLVDKDKLGDWMESYANALDLNVWAATEAKSATYDEATGRWTLTLSGATGERVVQPKHIIFATGLQAIPKRPSVQGEERYSGEILHSATFTDGKHYAGKKVVVVGAGSSAHDIALDLYEQGAETTLVQRGPSYIMSTNKAQPLLLGATFGAPTEIVDFMMVGTPWPITVAQGAAAAQAFADVDKELLEGLDRIGFGLTFGGVGTQTFNGGAYYFDQGCSQLLIDGKIGFQRAGLSAFDERHLVLDNGVRLEADAVVFATGFENMRETARPILGDGVTDQLTDVWGIDEVTHEIKGLYVDPGHPGVWFHSGALYMTRQFSGTVALQIKALELGLHSQQGAAEREQELVG